MINKQYYGKGERERKRNSRLQEYIHISLWKNPIHAALEAFTDNHQEVIVSA